MGGIELEHDKDDKAKSPENSNILEVELDKSSGAKVGLDVSPSSKYLEVVRVTEGLVQAWNGFNEEKDHIKAGYLIFKVNGVSGEDRGFDALVDEIKGSSSQLVLFFYKEIPRESEG